MPRYLIEGDRFTGVFKILIFEKNRVDLFENIMAGVRGISAGIRMVESLAETNE